MMRYNNDHVHAGLDHVHAGLEFRVNMYNTRQLLLCIFYDLNGLCR